MGLADLFAANDDRTLNLFGKGVSAGSVVKIDPDGTETEITNFVFEQDQTNQVTILPTGEDASESAFLEIAASYSVGHKTAFRIDGRIWQYAGVGGRDQTVQTVLLHNPRQETFRQQRVRGS